MKQVTITRSGKVPSCVLGDYGKVAAGGEVKVDVEHAADLIARDPSDWSVKDTSEMTLVKAEIKRREQPPTDAKKGD